MPILSVANLVAMSSHSVYRRLLCLVMTAALLALVHPPSQQPPGTSTSLGPPFLCHDTLAWMSWGSFRPWLVDWAASVVVWRTYGMGKSAFQTGLKLHPLVSPTILSANMWDMFHFFLVFTYTKDFLWFISWCLVSCDFLFCFVLLFSG